jgi:hypothetical protein
MDAFLADFKCVVFAESPGEANERIRVWRSLAAAAGFEPGAGRVSALRDHELTADVTQALEKARAKSNPPATDYARETAIRGLAGHFAGDLGFAREIVESIERETGPLPAAIAKALAHARTTGAPA